MLTGSRTAPQRSVSLYRHGETFQGSTRQHLRPTLQGALISHSKETARIHLNGHLPTI
jgi:hypothetical protein